MMKTSRSLQVKDFFKRLSDTAYIKYDAQKDEIEIAAGKVVLKDLNAD